MSKLEHNGVSSAPLDLHAAIDAVTANPVELVAEIAELRSANAELKRQLEVANEQADIHRQWNLGYMKSNDAHRTALLASQAREVKYRDALENYKILCQDENHYSHYVDALKALALPHDDTALREYRNAIVEECAKVCDGNSLYDDMTGSDCASAIRKLKKE